MVSILGIIIGLAVFIIMAYKGFNTIFAAIIGSIIRPDAEIRELRRLRL